MKNSIIILAVSLSFSLFSNAQVMLDSGMVAKYYFNGNANDEWIFGNDGIIYGAVLEADRAGNTNSAYRFDGTTSFIKVPNSSSLTLQNSISISAWFKTSDPHISADPNGGYIVSKAYTNGSRAYTIVANDITYGDSIVFQLFNTSNTQFRSSKHSNYYNDKWHHIVTTYDYTSGISKIYVDSILVTTKIFGQINLSQTTVPLSIGCYWNNSTATSQRGYFNGLIDDIRIYNRAITQEEVSALYHEIVAGEQSVSTAQQFSLYPNPCRDYFTISSPDEKIKSISVFDTFGRRIYFSCNPQSFSEVDMQMFPAGIYKVLVLADNSSSRKLFSLIKY